MPPGSWYSSTRVSTRSEIGSMSGLYLSRITRNAAVAAVSAAKSTPASSSVPRRA
jgi:hypothetical protein